MAQDREGLPERFLAREHRSQAPRSLRRQTAEELEGLPVEVKVGGRMMLKRVMGKASFATCRTCRAASSSTSPATGRRGSYADFKTWDLGDISASSAP
jgi:lysyl-tRNA synthetase class 2